MNVNKTCCLIDSRDVIHIDAAVFLVHSFTEAIVFFLFFELFIDVYDLKSSHQQQQTWRHLFQ